MRACLFEHWVILTTSKADNVSPLLCLVTSYVNKRCTYWFYYPQGFLGEAEGR